MTNIQVATNIANLHHYDPDVRHKTAEALGNLRDASAVPALLKELEEYGKFREFTSWQDRWHAAHALGEIGDFAAVLGLKEALADTNKEVRRRAAYALGQIGDASAIPDLIEVLTKDSGPVGIEAARALGMIGDPSAVPALIKALKHPYRVPSGCIEIVNVLGRFGSTDAIPALVGALKDRDVCRSAIVAVRNIGGDATTPVLVEALTHTDPIVRRSAADALGKIGMTALPALLQTLRDEDALFSQEVTDVLAKIGSPVVPNLAEALKEDSAEVRCRAAEALGKIGDTSACSNLTEALQDASAAVRWDVAYALEVLGDASGVPVLVGVFQDKDLRREVFQERRGMVLEDRNRRAEQLGRTLWKADTLVVPALLDALMEENRAVRNAAVEVLRQLGSSDTLPRKILAEGRFSVQERIDVLERLRQVRRVDLRYKFPETLAFCRIVLTEKDVEACEGAQLVLSWMTLLRGSQVTASVQSHELVRPVLDRALQSEPEMMLRAADQPEENGKLPSRRRTIWHRLFEK